MPCAVHGIAAGPDGRCALCNAHERSVAHRASSRRWRPVARVVVALVAGVVVFAWLLATFDTKKRPPGVTGDAGAPP
jgi:hypothetical protein